MELTKNVGEMSQVNFKMSEYENKIALLSQDRERLEMMLKNKTNEFY